MKTNTISANAKLHTIRKREKGVVLISCIVFLVLILLMLKVTLSGAKVTEKKAGIDQDIFLARENAQLALRAAEEEIISVVSREKVAGCTSRTDTSTQCIEAFQKALVQAWTDASPPTGHTASTDETISAAAEKIKAKIDGHAGYYTKADQARCKDKPLWKCVNWNAGGGNYYAGSTGSSSIGTSILVQELADLNGNKSDVPPRYIIERFLPGDIGFTQPDANMLFRITAIGFGQSGGSTNNVTNAIYQANYAL